MSEFVVMLITNRTQRVQIDHFWSDFTNIVCGVPQCSVLRLLIMFMLTTLSYRYHLNVNIH